MRRLAGWTTRQELEAQAHGWRCSMVTLTFSDDFLPGSRLEAEARLRSWFMRVRRTIDFHLRPEDAARVAMTPAREAGFAFGRFRYYLGAELGSRGGRFHVHVNVFGLLPEDRIGERSFAEIVRATWSVDGRPIGRVDIRPLKPGGARYVAKYVGKAIAAPDLEMKSRGMEFQLVSNGGGRSGFGGLGSLALPAIAAGYSGSVPDDVSCAVALPGGRRGWLTTRLADRLRRLVGMTAERIAALRVARLGELVISSRERRWLELSAGLEPADVEARYARFCQYWQNWRC